MDTLTPLLRSYISEACAGSNASMTWLRRRTYSLLSFLWSKGVRLPPAKVAAAAGLPARRLTSILNSPEKATLADVWRLLDALRVDLDWLDAKTDVLKYAPRWGVPSGSFESRTLEAEAARETERLAVALLDAIGRPAGSSGVNEALRDAVEAMRSVP